MLLKELELAVSQSELTEAARAKAPKKTADLIKALKEIGFADDPKFTSEQKKRGDKLIKADGKVGEVTPLLKQFGFQKDSRLMWLSVDRNPLVAIEMDNVSRQGTKYLYLDITWVDAEGAMGWDTEHHFQKK